MIKYFKSEDEPIVCFVVNNPDAVSETFIKAQQNDCPFKSITLYGDIATLKNKKFIVDSLPQSIVCKIERLLCRKEWNWTITQSYKKAFKKINPSVVIAQFGPIGVRVLEACKIMKIPLIVYFRGYDASVFSVLEHYKEGYKALFKQASYVIAVSPDIKNKLVSLGADPAKVIYQSSGVDCNLYKPTVAGRNPPTFLAAGRLVNKKAPHLLLLAFHQAWIKHPNIHLRLIGDGPLSSVCHDLVTSLNMEQSVDFLGSQPHEKVIEEMQKARCFLQHSVKALNGDSEGTPNSVMEASASALPVIATRHAGIKDIIKDKKTGFLVNEKDIISMADHILTLANSPALATDLGKEGREFVCSHFSRSDSNNTLYQLITNLI